MHLTASHNRFVRRILSMLNGDARVRPSDSKPQPNNEKNININCISPNGKRLLHTEISKL